MIRGLRARAAAAAAFLAVLAVLAAWAAPAAATPKWSSECSACHACREPTTDQPCLRECLRDGAPLSAAAGPDVVTLDQIEDLYVPVRFDHASHAKMTHFSGDCTYCHHHTPKGEEHPACRSCHPVEIIHEDLAQPGLKGAYHRQCLGCHTEWDRDTSCEICHEKKAGGRLHGAATGPALHAHHDPVTMLEIITFPTEYEDGDEVPFHHRRHSQMYEPDCAVCHQEQSCTRCHAQSDVLHPMGNPDDVDLHDYCFRCHDPDDDPSFPDNGCAHCHGRAPDDLFTHTDVGWDANRFHKNVSCRSCHGPWTSSARPDRRCASCHDDRWDFFDHAVTGVTLDETHLDADCTDCHADGVGTAATCDACHDDDRVYGPDTVFGASSP